MKKMSKRALQQLIAETCQMARCKLEELIFRARRWRYGPRRRQRQLAVHEARAFLKTGAIKDYVLDFLTGGHYREQTS